MIFVNPSYIWDKSFTLESSKTTKIYIMLKIKILKKNIQDYLNSS